MSNINDAIIQDSFSRHDKGPEQGDYGFDLSADPGPESAAPAQNEFESSVVDGDFEAVAQEKSGVSKKRILFMAIPLAFAAAAGAMYFASSMQVKTSAEPDFADLKTSMQQAPSAGIENATLAAAVYPAHPQENGHGTHGGVAGNDISTTTPAITPEAGATSQQQIIQPAIGSPMAAPTATSTPSAAMPNPAVSSIPVQSSSTSPGVASANTSSQAAPAVVQPPAQPAPAPTVQSPVSTVAKKEVAPAPVSQVASQNVPMKTQPAPQPETKKVVAAPVQPTPKKVVEKSPASTQAPVAKKVAPATDSGSGILATSDALANDVKPLVTVTANQIGLKSLTKEALLIANNGGASQQFRVGDYLPNGDQLLFIDSQAATIVTDKKIIRVAN